MELLYMQHIATELFEKDTTCLPNHFLSQRQKYRKLDYADYVENSLKRANASTPQSDI